MERTAPKQRYIHNAPCANDQLNETNAVDNKHWLQKSASIGKNGEIKKKQKQQQNECHSTISQNVHLKRKKFYRIQATGERSKTEIPKNK